MKLLERVVECYIPLNKRALKTGSKEHIAEHHDDIHDLIF